MADTILIGMNAIFGDGTVNYYRGPDTPEVRRIVEEINNGSGEPYDGDWDGMARIMPNDPDAWDPDDDGEMPTDKEISDCDTEADLIESLVWWVNCGEEEKDWAFDPR